MLGHPITVNPQLIYPIKIQIKIKKDSPESASPKPIANFKGRSEKDRIISSAKFNRFFMDSDYFHSKS